MPVQNQQDRWRWADEKLPQSLPAGANLVRILRGHTGGIGRIAWSPDGKTVASPSFDKTVRLWEVETGTLIRTLVGDPSLVLSTAYHPTGDTLASGSGDNTVKLWEISTGRLL